MATFKKFYPVDSCALRTQSTFKVLVYLYKIEKFTCIVKLQEMQSFIDKVLEAKQQEIGKRPSEYSQWQDWGLGNQISDLEQFALCKATPENCLKMLHSTGFEASPTGAAECLQFLGYWPAHVQLAVKRLDLDAPFSQDIQNAVKQIHENPCEDSDANIRVDFTHHRVVTIDDASTTEVDDGLSVEHLEDGRKKIWVHIADPTRFLHPHQLLDQTARDRATTIYLPTGKIPMFPLEVAEVDFSLNMQEECNALSIGVIMGEDGSLQHYEFVPSKILPTQKLTYDQTDEIIDSQDEHQHSDIFIYHKAAQLRFQYRMNMGAIQINLPECQPYADPDSDPENPEVELRVINRQLSRNLVAEMMIMAGEAAGRFGEQHQIPLPYRGQLQPVFPEGMNIHELPEGVCREAAKRTIMTRSIFSPSQPVRHASLGLNHYVQVSSPIRRYGDILTHFQIKSFLSGRPLPFSIPQVKEIMEEVNFKLREFKTKVDSECRKYWISEYFRQNKDKEYRALFCRFIRQEFGLAQALIEDLGLEVVAKVYRPVVEGEYITLRVVNVHVASGLFRLEEPWKGVVGDSMDGEASYVDADDIGLDSSYVDVVSSNDPHIY
eukprot:TRINITY_DN12049_c0_g1_i7.p1 TRINITY_DN12049_c0_g1~~TRINITY_DN12049_c0_g1_i7.p1  ORF type:complete len:605 (-),score=100.80 TRINITY_DN12049_c0_g1_i7:774-2588(-)